jgi:hypothetical protein
MTINNNVRFNGVGGIGLRLAKKLIIQVNGINNNIQLCSGWINMNNGAAASRIIQPIESIELKKFCKNTPKEFFA